MEEASLVDLQVNISKTKAIRIDTNNANLFHIQDAQVEEVDEFFYLGSMVSKDSGALADVDSRIRKASATFGMLNNI